MKPLEGKVVFISVGVANAHSIAAGCAQAFADAGAQVVTITYVNETAKPYVQPISSCEGEAAVAA